MLRLGLCDSSFRFVSGWSGVANTCSWVGGAGNDMTSAISLWGTTGGGLRGALRVARGLPSGRRAGTPVQHEGLLIELALLVLI
jgi:hypothetical protein